MTDTRLQAIALLDRHREAIGSADHDEYTAIVEEISELLRLRPPTEARGEPVGYLFELRYGPDHWSPQQMYSERLPKEGDYRNVTALYSHPPAREAVDDAMVERAATWVMVYSPPSMEISPASSSLRAAATTSSWALSMSLGLWGGSMSTSSITPAA